MAICSIIPPTSRPCWPKLRKAKILPAVGSSDNPVTRKLPSRIANWLMAKASGMALHDFGTTFKAYRSAILKDINLYGELHRFIPALAGLCGPASRKCHSQCAESHYDLSLPDLCT